MFFPKDFLAFSKEILDCEHLKKNEALFRSVISRAYYSAFLSAREKIDELDNMILKHYLTNMHQQVMDVLLLNSKFFVQDNSLSSDLMELHNYRIDADYHFEEANNVRYEKYLCSGKSPDLVGTAEDSWKLSNNIINRVALLK